MAEILRVEGLSKGFPSRRSGPGRPGDVVHAVNEVNFTIESGKTLGLVGESGCGKTTTGRMVARMIPPTAGRIIIDGVDVTNVKGERLRRLREMVQMVFQDPYSSLSGRLTVHDIVAEPLRINHRYGRNGRARVIKLLEMVGMGEECLSSYAHEFSGGQRQRISIARALALEPKIIVLDEPVSALDVSIQAQVLNMLRDLQLRLGVTYLFISHDLSVVRHVSHDVAVMYLGRIVEMGDCANVFGNPRHPYTNAMITAAPTTLPSRRRERILLSGELPSPTHLPSGCAFHGRCPQAQPECAVVQPALASEDGRGRLVACHYPLAR